MKYDYDLFVIGAGSGGVRAARMASQKGARVGIAEERFLGGTCVNVGCVPKKLFVYASEYREEFQNSQGFGWDSHIPDFDWFTLRENKNKEIKRLNGIYQHVLETAGVQIFHSHAKLIDANSIQIGNKAITTENILIATGGHPFIPEFPGHEFVMNSDDVFYMDKLPRKVSVVGGGYIALEFAGILHGLGCETQLVYRRDLPLRGFDKEVREFVLQQIQEKGIQTNLACTIQSIQKTDDGLVVHFDNNGSINVDAVIYATGRKPNIEALGIKELGVELSEKGYIKVDQYYQSSIPGIFALGDVIGGPELTPVAIAEAMAFVERQFGEGEGRLNYQLIPTAVFCQPNIATVGLTEEQADLQGIDFKTYRSSFSALKNTISGNTEKTLMKLLVDTLTDKVIGAHMVGSHAGEIIQGVAIALKAGATKAIFDETIGIHPTAAEEFVTMRN